MSMDVSGIYQVSSLPPRWLKSVEPLVEHSNNRVAGSALNLMVSYNVSGYRELVRRKLRTQRIPEEPYLTFLAEFAEDPGDWLDQKYVRDWCKSAKTAEAINEELMKQQGIEDPEKYGIRKTF